MRLFSLFLLLSFFGFALAPTAGAQHAPSKKAKVKKAGQKTASTPQLPVPASAGPMLTFERTPCFGTCPAYSMQVFANGRVAYEGRHAVPLMGKHELQLPATTVTEMLRRAKAAYFETFAKEYKTGATDLPSTVVAIRQPDGSFKKVTAESNAPENVKGYFAYLTAQFDQLAQLKGMEK